ncbi:MAG: matrixin family metalloprotease, partial [Candidatus Eisenbacteria bacterium]|nr:matrixin family metalloprotease [Candidatus Eisenbacteria bacterium]
GDACLCNEFVGRLEDVRVFNAALSEQAIENFMFSFDGTEPAVVSYWGLNEGAGQTVEDLHPVNTNDGVLGTTVAVEDIDPSWTVSNAPLASLTHNNNIAAIWAGQTQSALDDFNTGLDITDTGFLSDDGDDIIFGHDGTIFSEVSTNLPVGYAARWARVWEIQVSDEGFQGGTVLLFFNAEEAGATLYSFSTSSLALIRRPVGSPANFEVVPTNGITVNQFTATVDLNVGNLLPGEYTLAMVEPWVDVADPVAAAVGAAGSEGVSWGDFDNDGDEDIYIATFNLPAQLLRNDGNGTFTEVANSQLAGSGLLGIVGGWWGDYDNNGNLDLVMSANSNRLATGDGAGGFVSVSSPEISDSAGINHRGISWVDYDNDGDLDLYMLSASARSVLLRNDGSNTWVDVTPAALAFATNFSCFQAAWADFDQDGDADVYIVRNTEPGALVRNDGGGVFTDITPSNLGTLSGSGNVNSAAWGYTSGDAYPDLLITGSLNCYLFRNDAGSGSFTNITPAFFNFGGRQGLWLDYNSDRRQDIFIVGSFTSNRLVENLGGAFADVTPPLLANAGIANKAAAAADYDNDGDVDIYLATTPPEPNRLFQNNLTKNWLKVKLVGTQSNRSGFGARVKADPDESPSNREVFSNSGRFSQNSLPVEFGFGSATSALVEVYWPSGIVQDLGSVPLNQTITVVETDTDGDGDGVGDSADSCPFEGAPAAEGRVDQDGDGCEDESGSFRALRYWDDSQFPLSYQTDAVGDPSIQGPDDFDALQFGFNQWLTAANRPLTGGDDFTRSGPAVVAGGDQVNSISFSDPSGFLPGVLAITPVTSAVDTITIGGTLYRPGQIIDADMKFNTLQFTFETFQGQGPPGSYNLASVAAHEFGHFFGISHSSVKSSTMFYVVPLGNGAVTLEGDDVAAAQRLYDQPSLSLTLEGTIFRGDGTTPVVGAGVFAISSATGDTLSMTTTNADGIYRLYDVPESFRVRVQPLDGSAEVNFLLPSYINAELGTAAETDFLAEFWDEASENNSDFGAPGFVMDPLTGPRTDGDIILNVDGTAPLVTGSNPENLATGVPITTALTMEFSEPIDKAYFASNPDISLTDATLGTPVGGAAAILEDGTLLVFTPSQALGYNQAYNWTVGPDIRDLSGNPLASAEVVTFTTEVQPPVSITSVTPSEVPEGGVLVISGTGFSSNVTDISVDFEDGFSKASGLAGSNSSAAISAQPFSASPDQVFVIVPQGAVSGDVSVLVAGQPVSNILQLTVVPPAPAPKANLISDISIGADVRKLAMTPDGDYAWIATSTGVAIVDAKPSSPNFSTVTPVTLGGGAVGVTMLPGGSHALAVGPTQPRLRAIDADDASAQFATVVSDKDLPENPRGVVSVPGTSEALVVSATQVTLIDASIGPNFGTSLRQWSHPGVLFRGDISVAADVDEAYAATTDGRVAVLGFATGENVVKTLQSGVTVREVAPLPTGQGFVSGDGTGVLRRFDDRGPLKNTLPLTGGYRGMTTTPDGSFVYAVNYVANRVDILDLQNNGLSLVDQFNTSID